MAFNAIFGSGICLGTMGKYEPIPIEFENMIEVAIKYFWA